MCVCVCVCVPVCVYLCVCICVCVCVLLPQQQQGPLREAVVLQTVAVGGLLHPHDAVAPLLLLQQEPGQLCRLHLAEQQPQLTKR